MRAPAKTDIVRLGFSDRTDRAYDMIFASDNWAGAHPKVTAALATHGGGFVHAYGNGDLDKAVEDKFSEIFEREVAVFFVGTGTAANSLSLTLASKPGGVGFCHREAHAIEDECGAPEYFTGGAQAVPGRRRARPHGSGAASKRAIAHYPAEVLHSGRPVAVSITQSTEIGTVYSLDEIAAISAICRKAGLPLHMDGARFANALVSLDTTPAEMTWKRGVDTLSFGGTKNGCWCAEAIVLFDRAKAPEMAFIHKRAAQLYSKSRFIAAQFDAYFEDGLWLETGAPRQFAGRQARRPHPRLEEAPPCLGAAGQRGFCGDDGKRKGSPAEEGRDVLRLAHAAFLSRRTSPPAKAFAASSPASRPPPTTSTRSAI